MGQKVHPKNFRIGPLYSWDSRWFADKKNYRKFLLEDVKIRQALLEKLKPAGITLVEIERSINKIDIILHVASPGVVIGGGGQGMEEIKKFIQGIISKYKKTIGKSPLKLDIQVKPVKEPNLNAYFMASQIADQL